jgi:hypothetical protein
MTATLPPVIKFQPLIAGQPLPGGKVKFYVAGTTTPQAVYAADGTTAIGTELTLDANGATSFRLGTGLSYKIGLEDVDGVPIAGWPEDNIQSSDTTAAALDASLRADLANVLLNTKGAGQVGYDEDLDYPAGTLGYVGTRHIIRNTTLASNDAALVVRKKPTDATNPNITALFVNDNDTGVGYDTEVHVRLQAGTTTSHRAYINFSSYDSVLGAQKDKWVTGRNAESCWILYNSETIHRLWMDPGASGPDASFRTGNTYLNSAESGKIRFNWHPSDRTGLGGVEVWSGGNNGSGVTNNVKMFYSYADAEPVGFTGSIAGDVLTVSAVDPGMGSLAVGMCLVAAGAASGVYIIPGGTGTGGPGTYNLSATVGTVASQHMAAWSGQTEIYSTKEASVGSGAMVIWGGLYVARSIRTSGSLQLGGAFGANGASPLAKPTISGSRGGNTALANLLTQLANYGLITDSTTA